MRKREERGGRRGKGGGGQEEEEKRGRGLGLVEIRVVELRRKWGPFALD